MRAMSPAQCTGAGPVLGLNRSLASAGLAEDT